MSQVRSRSVAAARWQSDRRGRLYRNGEYKLSAEDIPVQSHELIEVRLVSVRYAARDTNLYEFQRPDGKPLARTSAGAHIDVHLTENQVRQYSLVNEGENPSSYIIGVKRDAASRGGSTYIHDQLRVGELLKISPPRNNFPLNEEVEHTVLIAGGIGITPILCMLNRLQALGKSWELHYSSRSRIDAPFLDVLMKLPAVHFHFDQESPGKFLDLASIVGRAPKGTHFYCCGPLPMLEAYEGATAGVPREQVHVEYFSSKLGLATDGGYSVEIASSGRLFDIPPGKTILTVLRDAGFVVPSSCEQGVCGACETRLLSGQADHRDAILTQSERDANETIMICCSGSKGGRLVLDL
jgi:ferredoxin-NADP reductase